MKYNPHPYQAYCENRIIETSALALWLDMGLGKTVITLTAIKELKYYRFAVKKVLVIAPKKVAEATWQKEAAKWDHLRGLRIISCLGNTTQRIKAVNTPGDIYIINRENVVWLEDYYRNDWPFDMVVVDESSSFKNPAAKRFKALSRVRGKMSRIIELTGTPAPNSLQDVWAQVYLLDQGARLGKYITHFRERYMVPDKRDRAMVYSYKPKDGAVDVVHQKISDICVSMKAEDYLQLPECVIDDIPVVLDPKAQQQYNQLERDLLLSVESSVIDVASAAALSNKLLQLCNGACYTDDGSVVQIHGCKLQALYEVVEGLNGQPVLLFYNFRHDIARIIETLKPLKLRIRQLAGKADEDAWNNHEVDVLLAHPASCAYGLNLQDGGNHIVWFGLNWSLELYQQANKRLHRQGQLQAVIIHRLYVEGARDEDVIAALSSKGATQNHLIDSLKLRIKRLKEVQK